MMTHRYRFALPALLLLVLGLALFSAACSGNDDNTSATKESTNSTAESGSTAGSDATKAGATTKATTKSGNGTSATGSDEQFVSGMCKAAKTFVDKLTKDMASVTPSATAESLDDLGTFFEEFFGNIGPAFEQFAKDFKQLKPPKDLAQWHADATTKIDAAAKALKDGKFDDPALQALGDNTIPEIPADINDRLEKIAKDNADCKELDTFSNDSSGGIFGNLGGDSGSNSLATATP